MTPEQEDKFNQLTAIREAVGKTTLLSSILDKSWFEALENEMANSSTTGVCAVDPSGFFDSLCHPLRDAPWFEAVQELFLAGRVDEIDTDGRLALAKGSPTLLFLARTPYGADRHSAEIAVNECFHANEFAALSGLVLADSWKFLNTSWHPGVIPDVPLTEVEEKQLLGWYAKR